MLYLLTTVVLLQSLNQVLRVGLPLSWLQLPLEYGAMNETVGCIGTFLGLMLVWRHFPDASQHIAKLPTLFLVAVLLSSVSFFLPAEMITAFTLYFLFMIGFEASYMVSMNSVLSLCRRDETPALMVLFYGAAFGGMTLTSIIMGLIVDHFGFVPLAVAVVAVGGVALVVIERAVMQEPIASA